MLGFLRQHVNPRTAVETAAQYNFQVIRVNNIGVFGPFVTGRVNTMSTLLALGSAVNDRVAVQRKEEIVTARLAGAITSVPAGMQSIRVNLLHREKFCACSFEDVRTKPSIPEGINTSFRRRIRQGTLPPGLQKKMQPYPQD